MPAIYNDGTNNPPRLRVDINVGVLHDLPSWAGGPRLEDADCFDKIRAAGYEGFQGCEKHEPALCRAAGLAPTAMGRVDTPPQAAEVAAHVADAGFEAVTLHVGTEYYDDDEMLRVAEAIVAASERSRLPMFIETHRATITQDAWRTIRLVERLPEVRFNADYSHWYTGTEMVYGDLDDKWQRLAPVFERARFMHGRIGNPSSMQVDIGDGTSGRNVEHFREMWTRSMLGFLREAKPGDVLCFVPELLKSGIYYARVFTGPDGQLREETDRWQQCLVLARIARECFAAAQKRHAAAEETTSTAR